MAPCLLENSGTRRKEFLELLARTRKEVPLEVTPSKPRSKDDLDSVLNSLDNFAFKTAVLPLPFGEALFDEETFTLSTEAGDQGKLPVLIVKLRRTEVENGNNIIRRPAVVLLHSSFRCKEYMRPLLQDYASRGYIAAAIDIRYHGERADSEGSYQSALVSAWKTGQSMPFIFDTVWDVVKLMDYFVTREDIDPSRIAIMGLSLGGMITIYAASADPRFAVAVPVIGTQNFQWAVLNNRWHARANSIPLVFREAAIDLGKDSIDSETVAKEKMIHVAQLKALKRSCITQPLNTKGAVLAAIFSSLRSPKQPIQ